MTMFRSDLWRLFFILSALFTSESDILIAEFQNTHSVPEPFPAEPDEAKPKQQ